MGIGVLALGGVSVAYAFGEFPDKVPVPADNPMTPAKIALGKQLYFDPRLSKSGTVSCDTCHKVEGNGTDNLPISFGVFGRLDRPRNTPTVYNAAFNTVQFWDGRAVSLEQQAEGPIQNPVEMDMHPQMVVDRLQQIPGYREAFTKVFGGKGAITFTNATKAIAAYERTLITPGSPYDQYLKGDKKALDASATAGMTLFKGLGCATCHAGPMFDNPGTPMGTGFYQTFPLMTTNSQCAQYEQKYHFMQDKGRFDVTHNPNDKYFFGVQSLRNVALTAPYFHNGSVQTLPEAVRVMAACQLGKTLSDQQVKDLVAFLNGLTGKFPTETLPRLPETPDTTILNNVPQSDKAAAGRP